MIKSSALLVAASSFMLIAPGLVASSDATGSEYKQKKATEVEQSYKALDTGGVYQGGYRAPIAPEASHDMWPGVPGMAPASPIMGNKPVYDAPRGGREY